jgi:AcrR family transcriptional regulator
MAPERPRLDPAFALAFRRRKIIEALARVSARKGYGATTVSDIVSEAEVARSTLYAQFPNKAKIAVELLEQGQAELFKDVEDACRDHTDLEAVERGLEAVVGWVSREPLIARACLVERYEIPEAEKLQADATVRMTAMLRERAPADDRRPAIAEEMVVGGVEMMLRYRLVAGEGEGASAALPGLREYVLRPFERQW